MKIPHLFKTPSFNSLFRRLVPALAGLAALALTQSAAQAQINVLANPGAETPSFGGWTVYNNAGYNFNEVTNIGSSAIIPPLSGNYAFFIYGDYNTPTEYNGMYQYSSAHPGEVFTADGWVYQLPTDSFTSANSANNAFLEVTFLDINSTTLARYRSISVTNGSANGVWYDLQVTNQLNATTYAAMGGVTNLVAPAGTVQVEYNLVFNLVNNGGGSTYWDNLSLLAFAPPPPYITNVSPASVVMATNKNFTFTAVAQSGNITNVQVTVTSVSGLVNPISTTVIYTNNSAPLTLSGLNTPTATGSLPLTSNLSYTITVLAVDNNLGTVLSKTTFDTVQPIFVVEAEDFNFNGGQFTNTPSDGGVDACQGLVGVPGIDENWINNPSQTKAYRPGDAVSTGPAGEITREKFQNAISSGSNTNALDYEVGYNAVGDWENYTRIFPSGNYNIYARMAVSGNSQQISLGLVGGDTTTSSQTVTNLGYCNVSGSDWNAYFYCPMVDSFGNLVTVHLGGQQTIRSTVTAGGPNINLYMIMPATGSPFPALVSSFPTGTHPFEPTNKLSITVGPANGSTISSSGIHMSLNGADVTSLMGLAAGVSNSWTVTMPLAKDTVYTSILYVTNNSSLKSIFTNNFDTFSQTNFMWEAEDFDFNGGQFIDNPVPTADTTPQGGILDPNSYAGYPEGNPGNVSIFGVDFTMDSSADSASFVYRPGDNCGTEHVSDFIRQKFLNAQVAYNDPNITDVDIGWWNAGWWLNYTRTYPTNTYYVYGRLAGGAGAFSGTTLAVVTNGVGTTTQQTNVIGSFSDPNAAGWQTWHWVPLLDTNGNRAVLSLGGVATLQIDGGGNLNANYYMLVVAPPVVGQVSLSVSIVNQQPTISFSSTTNHTYTLLYKNNLTDATWGTLGSVSGDGTVKSLADSTATGVGHRFYKVQIQ